MDATVTAFISCPQPRIKTDNVWDVDRRRKGRVNARAAIGTSLHDDVRSIAVVGGRAKGGWGLVIAKQTTAEHGSAG